MENTSLSQLTKKNQEFIHIATNQFIQDGLQDEQIKAILEGNLPEILEKQKAGIPARSFLGAPTVWASSFSAQETADEQEKPKNTNPWLMWLDSVLFFLAIIALVSGAMNLINNQAPTYGVISLLALSLGGGAVMYALYYYMYRHANKPKDQRPKLLKSIGFITLSMLAWMVLFTLTGLLPVAINPALPALASLVIGAVAFAIRYYLKKKYNIENAMTARPSA